MFIPTAGLIICNNRKVLLQKRADNGTWAMHGGGMQPNEEFFDALKREIKEEMNIEPINPKLFGIYTGEKMHHEYPNGDKVYIINHVFFCEDYKGDINFNDGEVKEYKWFDIDNLPENLMDVDIPPLKDIGLFLETKIPIIR
jgi:ADP-ribose pyrophosphatase YjhB (NUDIX family)